MFKFDFDLDLQQDDDAQDNLEFAQSSTEKASNSTTAVSDADIDAPSIAPFQEIDLQTLLGTLPPTLSCTPLRLPNIPFDLLRRDMFDAQFQQIDTADDEDEESKEKWGPETDLVKGVYEGGMKTWECSIDLVNLLREDLYKSGSSPGDGWKMIEGKKIMEVGCGTSLPSLYLLSELLRKPSSKPSSSDNQPPPRTTFYFLDYNELVLKLVTLPNVLLAFSPLLSSSPTVPASTSTSVTPSTSADPTEPRSTSPTPSSPEEAKVRNGDDDDDEEEEEDEENTFTLSAARIQLFKKILAERNIELRFFSGGWQTFDLTPSSAASNSEEKSAAEKAREEKMDIVLTSETVYQATSLRPLVQLLQRVSHPRSAPSPTSNVNDSIRESADSPRTRIWVAAKVLYFGLEGGGVPAFVQAVQAERGGWVKDIWKNNSGVLRWVGEVGWDQ